MGRILHTHYSSSKNKVSQGECANREFIKRYTKNHPQINNNSEKNLWSKSNACKKKRLIIKWISKGSHKAIKTIKRQGPENDRKKGVRNIWYGGPRRPRNTYKFKDNSSDYNLPKEKMK